jgi:hypothetical protein
MDRCSGYVCRWDVFLVCFIDKGWDFLKGLLSCGSNGFGHGDRDGFHFDVFQCRGSGGNWVLIGFNQPIGCFDFRLISFFGECIEHVDDCFGDGVSVTFSVNVRCD